MFGRPPPREIAEIINFPRGEEYKFDEIKFYNKVLEKQRRGGGSIKNINPSP